MCKETPDTEKCQTSYFWRDVSVPVLSPCFYLCVSRFFLFLFCFVRLCCLGLIVLSFCHFEGSFHFWAHLWGLVLRPFSTCSFFNVVLPFFMFPVAFFSSGCFFFSVLFSQGRHRAPRSLLCATFLFVFVFVLLLLFLFLFLLGRLPPNSFLTGSVLTSLLSLDPFTVELFHLGLVPWPSCLLRFCS